MKCWVGNLDGSREALVMAHSQSSAAKVLGMSTDMMLRYFNQQPLRMELKPHTLYTRPYSSGGCQRTATTWTEGRCPLEPRQQRT